MKNLMNKIDSILTSIMRKYGVLLLRISIGIIFVWFGVLKFFPNVSPAQGIATETINILTFGIIQKNIALVILAIWETLIGIGLIVGKQLRIILFLLFAQMLGTLTPLVLFPNETFTYYPIVPTLEGQYIIKNLIIISAGLVVGATVHSADTASN